MKTFAGFAAAALFLSSKIAFAAWSVPGSTATSPPSFGCSATAKECKSDSGYPAARRRAAIFCAAKVQLPTE